MLPCRAPLLKSLHLIMGYVSNKGFAKTIKMLPLLEELEISLCEDIYTSYVVEVVAGACPQLKHFRLVTNDMDFSASMVSRMHKLRSLHLVGVELDNKELTAILDNCHDLEYLNMRPCNPIIMDDNLRVKLARINMDDCEYSSDSYNCYEYWYDRRDYHPYNCACRHCSGPYFEYDDDLYDTYYYCTGGDDDVDDVDIEEHEKTLDIKSMRRYVSR